MSNEIKTTVIGQETYTVGISPAMKARAVIELTEWPREERNGITIREAYDEIQVTFHPLEEGGPITIKKTEYDKITSQHVTLIMSSGNAEVIGGYLSSDLSTAHKKYVKEIAQIEANHHYAAYQEAEHQEVMDRLNAMNEEEIMNEEETYGICPAHIFTTMCEEAGVEHEATHDQLEVWLTNGFDEWAEDLGISAHKSRSLFVAYLAERTMILVSHQYRAA
jgi:hypothetical protein